jgi:hypothetical protein
MMLNVVTQQWSVDGTSLAIQVQSDAPISMATLSLVARLTEVVDTSGPPFGRHPGQVNAEGIAAARKSLSGSRHPSA